MIKPVSAALVGDDYLLYGLSKYQFIYLYRFDHTENKYVFVERSSPQSKGPIKKVNSNVVKLTVNSFNLSDNFG